MYVNWPHDATYIYVDVYYMYTCVNIFVQIQRMREGWRTLSPKFLGPINATWASIVTVTKSCMTCAFADLQPI